MELQQELDATWKHIDDDFAFIAATNVGGEFMTDDAVTRLHSIAQRQWTKTIDEGQGLSWEERRRYEQAETKLGESESVLADQPITPSHGQLKQSLRLDLRLKNRCIRIIWESCITYPFAKAR